MQKAKVEFVPIDANCVKLYVCGPTVYSFPHIGNARSVVVYDLLFRLLSHLYKSVTYVRNITDVDDKIVSAADKEGKKIEEVSSFYAKVFERNMYDLNCMQPTVEPRVTDHVDDIISFISKLLQNGSAYNVGGCVYFDISSYSNYGDLSGRKLSDLIAGSRISIDSNKRNPGDFVLWKSVDKFGWDSPWGYGRPGWHIECSVMSDSHLGCEFDIHGGGADLQFPHHENEIAQSRSVYPSSSFARYWVHNGFVLVDSEKMSKSIGNVVTVQGLLDRGIAGVVIRYALLSSHYRKPLNWSDGLLSESANVVNKFLSIVHDSSPDCMNGEPSAEVLEALSDDLNISRALGVLHGYADKIKRGDDSLRPSFVASLWFLGLLSNKRNDDSDAIQVLVDARVEAKRRGDFAEADRIREKLDCMGVKLFDGQGNTTTWKLLV